MHDTLEHLVRRAIRRRDSNKFLYVLNQIDATAQEDNTRRCSHPGSGRWRSPG